MVKQLCIVLICFFSFNAFAQTGTASPYSFFGIGSLKFKGTVENRSMGGMSVYLDSIHVNLKNPAAYAGKNLEGTYFNGESRPVKFAVAGVNTGTTFKSSTQKTDANSTTFDYLAASFPVGKFGVGFGLLPYTSVGYRLETLDANGNRDSRFNGEGGLNRVFAGLGYAITDNIRIGIDANYNFGSVENSALVFAYDSQGNLVQYQTRQDTRSDLSGLTFNFGLSFQQMITDKLQLFTTATFSPESNLSSENQRAFATVLFNAFDGSTIVNNTIIDDLDAKNLRNTNLTLPSRYSFGAGIGKPKSWFVGAEYTFQETGNFSNPIYNNQSTNFENASEISIGGFYIPRYNALSGYLKRVVYRGGFRFSNTGLIVNNESINEFGISFGLGLPIGNPGLFSNANIGLEYGQRGTTNQNLIQENFLNFNLSLSLNSRWFQKRKYN